MLTNNQLKFISSLVTKKYRSHHNLFIVEGEKGIREFLSSPYELHSLFAISDLFGIDYFEINEIELKKISQLKSPNKAVAIFKIPTHLIPLAEGLIVALDAVRDPGNLGTIIRLCDWFGVTDLVGSVDTVDCYNPKVVQSTMGSLSRVRVHYLDLKDYLSNTSLPIYGTFLEGESIYTTEFPKDAILLMGNESNGISEILLKMLSNKVTIPRFDTQSRVESLNVATATAICLNEFRRNLIER